ncbi:MAG: DUF2058 family protein [Xanthomonadales bacterium]|nr:DUF2058 family protein [Xanthomonadales bacterium]MCB1626457.1 DUF2058 family protein [Xanthomonadales bacterium]MCB1633968.1 DUF2058 family protein [Xanthomonadales bacterium]
MVSSLKDALLQAGLKPAPKAEPTRSERPRPGGGKARLHGRQRPPGKPKASSTPADLTDEQVSLAAAYKARARAEQREQAESKRQREAAAAAKRARQAAAEKLLDGRSLNVADAEDSRYFEYSRKIRRVYVTPEQNQALTEGRLGIVQMRGRFHVVDAEVAKAIEAAAPEYFALLLDPDGVEAVVETPADSPQAD